MPDDPSKYIDPPALQNEGLHRERRSASRPSNLALATIVALGTLLIGQIVHNFRQPMPTSGFLNTTIAPVYRMLGSTVKNGWEIRGLVVRRDEWQPRRGRDGLSSPERTSMPLSRPRSDPRTPLVSSWTFATELYRIPLATLSKTSSIEHTQLPCHQFNEYRALQTHKSVYPGTNGRRHRRAISQAVPKVRRCHDNLRDDDS